jgi:Na+-transporting NADH:ubiquinone oxidoreductase subunit NqrA
MEVEVGRVTHYYSHLHVAAVKLTADLKEGDFIHILGHTTDFMQRVTSLEVEHHRMAGVHPGEDVGLKVIEPVHEHDVIYRVPAAEFEPYPLV